MSFHDTDSCYSASTQFSTDSNAGATDLNHETMCIDFENLDICSNGPPSPVSYCDGEPAERDYYDLMDVEEERVYRLGADDDEYSYCDTVEDCGCGDSAVCCCSNADKRNGKSTPVISQNGASCPGVCGLDEEQYPVSSIVMAWTDYYELRGTGEEIVRWMEDVRCICGTRECDNQHDE